LEVHLRTAELEPLVARAERLGNRIAASVLLAAVINGVVELAAADRVHPRDWRAPARVAALGAVGGYVAWRRGRVTGRVGRRSPIGRAAASIRRPPESARA
jgi:ubiquinone biosynthesis protein